MRHLAGWVMGSTRLGLWCMRVSGTGFRQHCAQFCLVTEPDVAYLQGLHVALQRQGTIHLHGQSWPHLRKCKYTFSVNTQPQGM